MDVSKKRRIKFAVTVVVLLFGFIYMDRCVLAGDIESPFYKSRNISTFGNYGEEDLSGIEKSIYNVLKAKIQAVANGEETSTKFEIPAESLGIQATWTKEELGITGNFAAEGKLTEETRRALTEQVFTQDNHKIFHLLLVNCPYDFYWFDKTEGASYTLLPAKMTVSQDGGSLTFTEGLVYEYMVAADYRDGKDKFKVSISKVQSAEKALANAQSVIKKHRKQSDHEKLLSYRDEICSLTSYDIDAAVGNYHSSYGDPWQMLYVFDKKPETKVVCEGYAKAFQYLCDESEFSGDVTVYTVTGWLDSGQGKVPHMWNLVSVDQKNYLVDVTSWDGGMRSDSGAFLLGTEMGNAEDGYRFEMQGNYVTYTYDKETFSLYGKSILTLDSENYGFHSTDQENNSKDEENESTESDEREETEEITEQEEVVAEEPMEEEIDIEVQRKEISVRNVAAKTGDEENPGKWLGIFMISGLALISSVYVRCRIKRME